MSRGRDLSWLANQLNARFTCERAVGFVAAQASVRELESDHARRLSSQPSRLHEAGSPPCQDDRRSDPAGRGPPRGLPRHLPAQSGGSAESVSGPGSTTREAAFIADLISLLRRFEARTLLDAPCGDFNWIGEVADSVEQYVGIEVVLELIEHNLRHNLTDRRRFALADISRDPLPRADVILCRDCLVHY